MHHRLKAYAAHTVPYAQQHARRARTCGACTIHLLATRSAPCMQPLPPSIEPWHMHLPAHRAALMPACPLPTPFPACLPSQEKAAIKVEKDAAEAKLKFALVDGRKEPVGNFRVEPPGLFRGRGEHPKMGMIKKRVYPRDITINIGAVGGGSAAAGCGVWGSRLCAAVCAAANWPRLTVCMPLSWSGAFQLLLSRAQHGMCQQAARMLLHA
jgi:hypothetical protein